MKKYMLLAYLDEKAWEALGEAEQKRLMDACAPHVDALIKSGRFLAGAPLHPTSMATTVSAKKGQQFVTDGPFAETREQLGGYTIIEAADLDDAIKIAQGFLGTDSMSSIEVRPIVELEGLPAH
jgi:hypothetical protein